MERPFGNVAERFAMSLTSEKTQNTPDTGVPFVIPTIKVEFVTST